MREFIGRLEDTIERSLKKWKQSSRIEDGPVVQIEYQFEQAHVVVDVFWRDSEERLNIECRDPRTTRKDQLKGLNSDTLRIVQDRLGNFAQIVHNRKEI